MSEIHTTRGTVALRRLAEYDPCFASLSLWCKHRDAKPMQADVVYKDTDGEIKAGRVSFEFAPAYTDGETVWYGEQFTKWTLDEQMAVCAHELMHVAFRHVSRGKKLRERFGAAYDPHVMNIATDAIINQTLLLSNYKLPRPCIILTELFKEAFGEDISAEDGIATYDAEKLYIKLMNESKLGQGGGKKGQKGQGQGQPGQGGGQPGDDEGEGEGEGEGQGQSPADKAKDYAKSKGFKNDMDDTAPSTPKDTEEDNNWQQRLARALQEGRLAGKGIGKLGHRIADVPQSKTPWEVLLRRIVTKAVTRKPRQTFDRPTRRYLGREADARMRGVATPAYEPGPVKQNGRPRIMIGVDVSGSISDQILEIFAGEISSIGNKTGSEIHVVVFDTAVLSKSKMQGIDFKSEVRKIEFARGGGTSFVEVIDLAEEIDPSVIVVLTDLYGPFGNPPKSNIPVIWATPEDNPPEAPFGKVLQLNS